MTRLIPLSVFLLLLIYSCGTEKDTRPDTFAPKVVAANGYVVPSDSIAEPEVIFFDESRLTRIPVGNPMVIPTNTNVHGAGEAKVVISGVPLICTPGHDTFALPESIPANGVIVRAGIPEVVIAKDAYIKDQNPECFSSLTKLQGLKHDVIDCMLQDRSGNLWFGTYGGGVSKYDGKSFTHFTEKDGLSHNTVWSILEDKSGNLWFGTYGGGVSMYDGKSFTHFAEKEGLSNTTVFSMLEDKSGNIWFGTDGGVSKYDGKSFTHFTEKVGLSNNFVLSMLEDRSGNLWFGTNGGVSKFDEKSFTHYTEKEGLSNNTVWSIMEDKTGNLWFGTDGGGACKYDGKSFTHFTKKEGLSNNTVRSILEDKSGNLWFGTYGGGVSKYDGKSFTHITEKEGLSNNTVLTMLEDKSGNLWFGTYGGVSKYDGKTFTHFTEKEGMSNNTVRSILEDKSGNLWFGTDGGGVSKYDGKSFAHFTEKEGLSNNTVWSILEDKTGNLWFGTNAGVSKYDGKSFTHFTEKEGLSKNTVLSMLEDKSGNLWFGTNGGASKYDGKSFTHITEEEGLSNNTVLSMLEDKSGNLWFGTYGGVSKYDGKSFTHFTEKEGLSNNTVRSMLEDESGNLWFSTYGGVCKYDGKSFTHFTEKEGLSNNTVSSILEDKSGNLWFGTRDGMSKLTPALKEDLFFFSDLGNTSKAAGGKIFFKNYTYDDGFLGIGVNGGKTIYEDRNGTIWVAANDRLTAFHEDGELAEAIGPNIQLTSIGLFSENIAWVNLQEKKDSILTLGNGVRVGNFEFDGITKWYSLPENLSLAYSNNFLTFNFIGITQKQSKKVKYQYILEGFDENWSAITTRTEAPYGNLPHGIYTFRVKAMNSEGVWSEPFEYAFIIRPPWWQTGWFRTASGVLALGSIVFYVKRRERNLKVRQKELEQTVQERTAEVVEQKHLIEEKHKEITDSINYAERIQRSFLATTELLDENLQDYFVFFRPKGVVSGDFYWANKLSNENFALVTADSTGHGVPGAIMSILNISTLEGAVKEGRVEPADILSYTRTEIISRLKKDGSGEGGKDGMDCSLIVIDKNKRQLHYAAANNPVWIIRSNQLLELSADKMPVGKHDKDFVPFTQHTIELQSGDVVYTLTDGMPDQFGGPKGKKFMYKQLKELLVSLSLLPMTEQHNQLAESLDKWKGNLEQVDDICIIGFRIQ